MTMMILSWYHDDTITIYIYYHGIMMVLSWYHDATIISNIGIYIYIGTIYDVWFYPHLLAPGDQDWPRLGLKKRNQVKRHRFSVQDVAGFANWRNDKRWKLKANGSIWIHMDPYGSMSLSLFKDLFMACSLALIEKHTYLGVRLTRQSMWKRQSSILNINTALTCCASLLPVKVRVLVGDANSPCCCFCALFKLSKLFVKGLSKALHLTDATTWDTSPGQLPTSFKHRPRSPAPGKRGQLQPGKRKRQRSWCAWPIASPSLLRAKRTKKPSWMRIPGLFHINGLV